MKFGHIFELSLPGSGYLFFLCSKPIFDIYYFYIYIFYLFFVCIDKYLFESTSCCAYDRLFNSLFVQNSKNSVMLLQVFIVHSPHQKPRIFKQLLFLFFFLPKFVFLFFFPACRQPQP